LWVLFVGIICNPRKVSYFPSYTRLSDPKQNEYINEKVNNSSMSLMIVRKAAFVKSSECLSV